MNDIQKHPTRRPSLVVSLLRWIGQHELGTTAAVFTLASGTLVFAEIASEVREGTTQSVDRTVLLALRSSTNLEDPLGPKWLEEIGRDITALGGFTVLGLVTAAVGGYLLLVRKGRAAAFVVISVCGAALLSTGLKSAFGRTRPDLVTHLSYVTSSSFPSGHSMLATAVYLTLGALLARLEPRLLTKAYIVVWALFLAVLVGASRVYVGVHWPTDVLAGWAAGAAWAALCWVVARALQRRGKLEREVDVTPAVHDR